MTGKGRNCSILPAITYEYIISSQVTTYWVQGRNGTCISLSDIVPARSGTHTHVDPSCPQHTRGSIPSTSDFRRPPGITREVLRVPATPPEDVLSPSELRSDAEAPDRSQRREQQGMKSILIECPGVGFLYTPYVLTLCHIAKS